MTTTVEEDRHSLLSPEAKAVVEATASVVAEHAEQITARFYPSVFKAHPELLRVFNQGNQATGEQSRALAASVVAYAVQLVDPLGERGAKWWQQSDDERRERWTAALTELDALDD